MKRQRDDDSDDEDLLAEFELPTKKHEMSEYDIDRLATRLEEIRKLEVKKEEQLKVAAAKYDSSILNFKSRIKELIGDDLTGEIEERIRNILGDIVDEAYTIKIDGQVKIYSFRLCNPMKINDMLIELLTSVHSVVSVQLEQSTEPGELLIQVHTTTDPVASGKYFENELHSSMRKREVVLNGLDNITKTTEAIIKTYFEIDSSIKDPHPVKIRFTTERRPLDVHTIGVKLPIHSSEIKALKANQRFVEVSFGPHDRTNGCLMTFQVYSIVALKEKQSLE